MSAPFQVDPDQEISIAGQWYRLIPDFNHPPPDIQGDRPTHAAVRVAMAAGQDAVQGRQQRMSDAAGNTEAGAKAYAAQEKMSSGEMKDYMQTASGLLKDFATLGSGVIGPITQAFTSAGASLGTAGASIAGTLSTAGAKGSSTPPPEHHDDHQEDHHDDHQV